MSDPLEEWYRAAIAETMRPCPEVSREDRAAKHALDGLGRWEKGVEHAGRNARSVTGKAENRGEAARCVNTPRPLTHLSDYGGRGLR